MSESKFIACQNNHVLGMFDTPEEAHQEVLDEIERDKFWLLLKKSLLRKILRSHGKLRLNGGMYYVAEIKEVIEE